ncbi:MAG TPA: helix-turn-helix domain-containing protein, partial [Candidatus Scalindua sp.]|nr:helix-turn-helix domain-containing protein [Candidatus Scalindua sp.]
MSYKNNKLQERSSREEIVQRMIAVLSLKRKKQLADKLKIRQDNISKFITRNDRSFYKIIIDFAENFNSSVDWLLTGEE